MKKILIVASVVSFIEWFNKEIIDYLKNDLGCDVHVACNFDYFEDTDGERTKQYINKIRKEGIIVHNIHFARNPFSFSNLRAYKELKRIIDSERFDLIHCHTPTVSILTRIAAKKTRKSGTVVMYTCHGFHFHKTAPLKNWLLYYPIEKKLSKKCDYLITINKEDYKRAKSFYCKNVRYIPGVGVDTKRIQNCKIDKAAFKESIGIPRDKTMILSLGELTDRKNHQVVIKALGQMQNDNVYYVICGKGPLLRKLKALAERNHVRNNVVFLGFRKDIPELCNAADIGALPSKIEGLGLAGIEIMSAGVPVVSSNVHGILDYVIDGATGYVCPPLEPLAFAKAFNILIGNAAIAESMKQKCIEEVKQFDIENALRAMKSIYLEALGI